MSYKTDIARFEKAHTDADNARMDADFERDCKNGTIGKVSPSGLTKKEEIEVKKEFHALSLESIKMLQEALDRIEKDDE